MASNGFGSVRFDISKFTTAQAGTVEHWLGNLGLKSSPDPPPLSVFLD